MTHLDRIQSTTVRNAIPLSRVDARVARTTSRLNSGLAIAALAFLAYYVVQTNLLSAQTLHMRDVRDRLSALGDERNSLLAQQAALNDQEILGRLASDAGLVPAGTVTYLVQDNPVAAAR